MDWGERTILESDAWFAGMPPDRRAALLNAGRVLRMGKGARVYSLGDEPNGLWAVLNGEVRLMGYPAPGLELLALSVGPGDWFGEMSTIDGGPRPHDAVAHTAAQLLHVSMPRFDGAAAIAPLLYHDLGRLVCRHERLALDVISQFAVPPRQRIARLILAQTTVASQDLTLRQEDLAAMAGLSRQTLNRHLGALASPGVIGRYYGAVRVIDRPALQRIALGT